MAMAVALVMVIEDEEALALLLKYNLEKEGFDVVWESSGNRALAAVEKYCPSVILLDWMLPELSGVEICKMIRNKPVEKALADLTVADVMTRTPRTISADKLTAEAVEMMEKHRINQLPVIDAEGILIGALNMHDLFRAKAL